MRGGQSEAERLDVIARRVRTAGRWTQQDYDDCIWLVERCRALQAQVEQGARREAALQKALAIALMYLVDNRAITAVRKALSEQSESERPPNPPQAVEIWPSEQSEGTDAVKRTYGGPVPPEDVERAKSYVRERGWLEQSESGDD